MGKYCLWHPKKRTFLCPPILHAKAKQPSMIMHVNPKATCLGLSRRLRGAVSSIMRRCRTTASPPAMRSCRKAADSEAPAPSRTGESLAFSADLHSKGRHQANTITLSYCKPEITRSKAAAFNRAQLPRKQRPSCSRASH